jgi:hypothetical protein
MQVCLVFRVTTEAKFILQRCTKVQSEVEHLPQMHAGLYVARLSGSGGEGMVKFVVE